MASPNESKKLQTEENDNMIEEQTPITPLDKQLSLFTKHRTEETKPPPSENKTTRRTKERVKEYLKPEFQIPEEELPDGVDKSSTYFNGAALNLPTGWLIELRSRPCGKQQDQFFYEHGIGKQFRSLKDALKHLGSVSDQTAIDYPTKKVAYPWTEIIKKSSKRKRTNEPQLEPQGLFALNNPPVSVVWCLESAEENRWIPEVPNAKQYTRAEELSAGIDRRSTYYSGAALNLPAGWLIELRPRSGGRHEDQFFHELVTGKQFRSMTEVLKRLGSSSNQSTIDESADLVVCTWTAIMKKRGKRKRTNEPQPPQQPELQHEPEPHSQPQPLTQDEPKPFDHNNPPVSIVWCLVYEENCWNPEFQNAKKYRSQWWEVSGFMSSNPNTDQAGGSGKSE